MSRSPRTQRKSVDDLLNAPWKLEGIARLTWRVNMLRALSEFQSLTSSDWIILDAMRARRARLIRETLHAQE